MTTLILYDRPAEGTTARLNLEGIQRGWRRTKRAIGGYHTGQFLIQNVGMQQLTDFYNSWIGMKIVERTFGIISWEGIIWQMDLIKNGVNYRRTLDPRYWHNNVQVKFTQTNGRQATTGYSENTSSSEIYGEMDYTVVIGVALPADAGTHRDRELTQYAWPQSRTVGRVTLGSSDLQFTGDGLYITTAGFFSTINYYENKASYTIDAGTLVSQLVNISEFVTSGRIEANSTSITIDGSAIPFRNGDMIISVISRGDTSGNIWKGGVYANQKFNYEPVPTTVDYILRDGMLYDSTGVLVNPALIDPGFYVLDTNAPTGGQIAGTSNVVDDPRVSYCDEVEFIWPDQLQLNFPGQGEIFIGNQYTPIPDSWLKP